MANLDDIYSVRMESMDGTASRYKVVIEIHGAEDGLDEERAMFLIKQFDQILSVLDTTLNGGF